MIWSTHLRALLRKRRSRAVARHEAMWWIYRLANPVYAEPDREAFADWLRASGENGAQLLLTVAALELSAQSQGFPPFGAIVAAAADASRRNNESGRGPWRNRVLRRRRAKWFGIAAALLLTVVGLILSTSSSLVAGPIEFSTKVGEHRTIELNDHSRVHLNTDSRVRVDYSSKFRRVYLLRGEARFDVQGNPEWPFDVMAACGRVRAVGTAFTVYARPDSLCELVVFHGRVRATISRRPLNRSSFQEESTEVADHEGALIGDNVVVKSISDEDLERRLLWTSGSLRFDGESLAQAIETLNRYNTTQVVVGDAALGDVSVGGYFRTTEPLAFAEATAAAFHARLIRSAGPEGEILILNRGGPKDSRAEAAR